MLASSCSYGRVLITGDPYGRVWITDDLYGRVLIIDDLIFKTSSSAAFKKRIGPTLPS
jgi:hypothetical protein